MPEEKKNISLSAVWKTALALLGYLIMGVWITGQLAADNKTVKSEMQEFKRDVRQDIREVKQDVRDLSRRVDSVIDKHSK